MHILGSRQSPHLSSLKRTPNQGSFPPPALPGFIGRMSPSDSCWTRPPKGRCHNGPGSPHRSPVLQVTACAYVLRPLPRRAGRPSDVGASGRPRRPSSDIRRLGARVDIFEACSGFTRVAARTLADPPIRRAFVPGASMVRSPSHLPGSYQGVPTPPWAGLSPAVLTYLCTAHWYPLSAMISSRCRGSSTSGCRGPRHAFGRL